MTQPTQADRRKCQRHRFSCNLWLQQIPVLGSQESEEVKVPGAIRDLGTGGLSVVTRKPVSPRHLIRCEIQFPDTPVAITTLMRIRWTVRQKEGDGYISGLQFLIK